MTGIAAHTFCSVDDGCPTRSSYPVVICFAQPPDGADASLCQEMHGKVTQPLLGNDYIRLVLDNLCTYVLDVLLFHLQ